MPSNHRTLRSITMAFLLIPPAAAFLLSSLLRSLPCFCRGFFLQASNYTREGLPGNFCPHFQAFMTEFVGQAPSKKKRKKEKQVLIAID